MKASEMTNEELAKALMSRVPLDSNNHDDIREASARLRKQDIIVAAQKAKGAAAEKREREAGAEAAQICGKIGEMIGREASKNQSVTNCNRLGNVAKMREALRGLLEIVCIDCNSSYKVDGKCVKCPRVVAAESALSAPPRNCDRPECATTKSAQDVWRKEDGGKTAYYDWLLATSTKGGAK